ncbi:Cytochrome P450, E-class, group I [Parasponia andersonii]|uniref:Cytochrome P450, E-class, group I n=1 Tax=Parasponia andersonii TaxID=3476 RepID=A0A2P5B3V8_PARAD|nr:Cytochrome P450, E-class, group I [Parasponia andersonii]
MVLKILKREITIRSTSKLPPGPWRLPILGNLHQLSTLPHHSLRDLANKHGPFMHLRLGEVPTLVVSSPEFAKEVMKTHDIIFASRPQILASEIMTYGSANIAFAPYGEYWRQLRKICAQELLSNARVQSFKPVREEELSNLIKWIASNVGSAINITERIYWSTFSITSRTAFGKKRKDQERFLKILKECEKAAAGFEPADVFPSFKFLHLLSGTRLKVKRLHKEADRIMENIIKEHKEDKAVENNGHGERGEDLVDVLLKFQYCSGTEFSLTTDNIKAVILDIFGGGSETSATAVNWAMAEMIKNPRVMKRAQEEVREVFRRKGSVDETGISEMTYLKLVAKETLRLHPSVPLLVPRESREKCEINGYKIPVKTRVIVNAWAIARDPKYWSEPDSFIPERFLDSSIDFRGTHFEYIPFGAGRRTCPGLLFGLINFELPLALLLYHFDWELPSGMKPDDLDMTEAFGATVKRKDDLHLIPTAYHPSPGEKNLYEN